MNEYWTTVLDLLKRFEGFKDSVYYDGKGIPTIGYGFTDPKLIKKGKISKEEADRRLVLEARNREEWLKKNVKNWGKLSDTSKAALISYYYNFPKGFAPDSNFTKYWNAGEYGKAIHEVDAGMHDKDNPGLFDRRLEEQRLLKTDPFLYPQPQITVSTKGDGKKVMKFSMPDYTKGEKRIQEVPFEVLQNNTVYPPAVATPEYLNPYNNADSPAYGGTNPRVKGIQEYVNDQRDELRRVLPDTVITNQPSPFAPPTLIDIMKDGKEKWVRNITGMPSIYDEQSGPTINQFQIPTLYANKGKDLPKYAPGKDEEQVERGGITYNVDPSAVEALKSIPDDQIKLNVTVPNTTVRSNPGALQARDIRNENARIMAARFLAQHPFGPNTVPVEPGLELTYPEFEMLSFIRGGLNSISNKVKAANNDFSGGIGTNWKKIMPSDKGFKGLKKDLQESVSKYINWNSTGTYDPTVDKFYFSSLEDPDAFEALQTITNLYNNPQYTARVLSRIPRSTIQDAKNLSATIRENLSNLKVSENTPYIIQKPGKLYQYLDDPYVKGMHSSGRVQYTSDATFPIKRHEFLHAANRPIEELNTKSFAQGSSYITENVNKPFHVKSKTGSPYYDKVTEQHERVMGGLADMIKRGMPINDTQSIQNYLGLPAEELPIDVVQLLENFEYNDVVNMFKNFISYSAPVIGGGSALYNQMQQSGILSPQQVLMNGMNHYNKGKDIYIKPSKRGTFTAAAKKRGKSVQAFASQVLNNPGKYSTAMRKKAQFAKNASKWKH